MSTYQIQIKGYHGQFVDYIGGKIFTGPFNDKGAANRTLVQLQEMTKRNHFEYRVNPV